MPPGSQEPGQLLEEASEEQSLMAITNPGEGEDAPAPEPKVKTSKGEALFQMGLGALLFFFFSRVCDSGIIVVILVYPLCCYTYRLLGTAL